MFLCLVFLMLSRLFIAALRSPAGKGMTSWLVLVMFIVFLLLSLGCILGHVWYLIVSFPDFCRLSHFKSISVTAELPLIWVFCSIVLIRIITTKITFFN